MKNNAIIILAILKVNFDEEKDYLQTFVPIVAEAIRCSREEIVSVPSIQEDLECNFGLKKIPQNTIKAILNKVKREGYIYLDKGVYKRNNDALEKLDFHSVQQNMLKKQEEVNNSLIKYCKEKFNLDWSQSIAENALEIYIEENQVFSIKNEVIPNIEIKDNSTKYFIGSFIQYLLDNNSYLLEYLEDVIKGMMISTTLFVKDPSRIKGNFKDTDVYLDTTFVIYALGYAGKAKQEPCKELLDMLYKYGAEIKCFMHTLDEIKGVLYACANKMGKGELGTAYGSSIEYFISEGKTSSDIILFISQLEKNMNYLNIKLVDEPAYNNRCYIDEKDLSEKLSKGLSYKYDNAVTRDVKSISAILRIRKGQTYATIENSRAIFVTTNNNLVNFINKYLSKEDEISGAIPIISDFTLTNLLWLKNPIALPDLPRKKIIADCFASTQPDERLWGKYIDEINKLKVSGEIGEDESYYFKYAPLLKDITMEITHGDEDVICEGTVKEIIELSRKKIETEARKSLEEDNIKLTTELQDTSRLVKEQIIAIETYAKGEGEKVGKKVRIVLLLCVVIAVIISFPIITYSKLTSIVKNILLLIIFAFSILTFLNAWKGTTVENIVSYFVKRKYESIINKVNRNNAKSELATTKLSKKN